MEETPVKVTEITTEISQVDQLLPVLALAIIAITAIIIFIIINNVRDSSQISNRIRKYISSSGSRASIDVEELLIREEEDQSVEETVIRILPTLEPLKEKFAAANINLKLSYYVILNLCVTLFLIIWEPIPQVPKAIAPLLYLLTCHLIADKFILGTLVKRNREKMLQQLPGALDMIIRSLRVGQTIDTAIRQTAQDLEDPLGIHFRKIIDDLSLGVPLSEAIHQGAERIKMREFDLFAIAVRVQIASGGNLSHALESISRTIRQRHNLILKVQALSAEGKVSAWIISLMPIALFGYFNVFTPEYVQILYEKDAGIYILAVAGFLLAIGTFSIFKIVKIKV